MMIGKATDPSPRAIWKRETSFVRKEIEKQDIFGVLELYARDLQEEHVLAPMGTDTEKMSTMKPGMQEIGEEEDRIKALNQFYDKPAALLLNQWKQQTPFERNFAFWCLKDKDSSRRPQKKLGQ